MRKLRKYEFGSKSAATTKINALGIDEEGNPTHSHSIVRLGHIVTTAGTYDEEGNELTAPVLSDKYAVDVSWSGEPHADWESAIVFPTPLGVHSFGSSSQRDEYAAKYCELFPDSEYCNPPEITE